jgi:class 3 adenylate cyclase/ferritin-like metal-binding protein YciE
LTSQLIEHLNEALSTENASVDRIISRIDQTPIQEVKQKLKQHLEETHIQKSRLERIITQLGGEPTDAKADLPTSMQSTTMTMRKILAKTAESVTEDNDEDDNSMQEEMELIQIKQDFIIEHDELVSYDALIQIIQRTELPHQHEITPLLEQSMQEEESMAYWYKIHTPLILDNLWPKIIHTSIKRGQNFLVNHISSKIPLIIMYADLVGSTTMSMTLPVEKLVAIIRAFTHELSHVVDSYGGYVLKYVGDAVISFFPCSVNNNDNKYLTCGTSVECAKSMINVIKDEINAILNKRYGYPELSVKIGIDVGENAIIQYGYEQRSPIDILGYTMNVAAKITSLTAANKVSIGGNVYKSLDHKIQSEFQELLMPGNEWKYTNHETDKPYKVYTIK